MTVLHINWHVDGFIVWGEQPATDDKPEGRYPHSPYSVAAEPLKRTLAHFLWEPLTTAPFQHALYLPSVGSGTDLLPLPSRTHLLRNFTISAQQKVRLEQWGTTAYALNWKQLFYLVGACRERRLERGIFAAEELMAVAQLLRFAGALVARGKYLPTLVKCAAREYEAQWQPVLNYADTQRLHQLATYLPPLFLQGDDAERLATKILAQMVDQLVRVSVVTTLSRSHAERGSYYSAHDAWFAALRGEKRAVRWRYPEELESLRQVLELWAKPCSGWQQECSLPHFKLEESESATGNWRLLITFSGGLATSATLYEAQMLALGQAHKLFGAIGRARNVVGGLVAELSTAEAHTLLYGYASLLEAAGYRVELPAWWHPEMPQSIALMATAEPEQSTTEVSAALSDNLKVKWQITCNGHVLTEREIESFLAAEVPLVYFRGAWVQIDVAQLQEALRFVRRGAQQGVTQSATEVVRLALGGSVGERLPEVTTITAQGWFDTFLGRMQGRYPFAILEPPPDFCGTLRPYQVRGYSWLVFLRQWGFGACLADDMGLGKTIQALAFLLHEQSRGGEHPTLLVAPMSVLGNWQREAQRFAPKLRCLLHHGTGRARGEHFLQEVKHYDVVLTSYNLLHRDYPTMRRLNWGGIILDEAQNIKNPTTRQAQAARALEAEYRFALTGTPVENHVEELWSIIDFLNPGILGKRSLFRDKYLRPIQTGSDPGAITRLRRTTEPFILRRLKTDKQIIADLPTKREARVICNLTAEQARLYREVLESFQRELAESEGTTRRGLILAVLTRLKQVCNHPANYLGEQSALAQRSGKLKRLEEMLETLFAAGESALIFTQYAVMGGLLQQRLCEFFGCEVPFLHGGTKRSERERLVNAFQSSAVPTPFVLSLKAGGIGLNLTRATHVFHYDRWWNPAVENQATDRAYRIGQTRDVMVHKFICGGTLEERIDAIIESKEALAGEVIGSGEAFLTELSDEELDRVLSLSEALVEEHE